MKYIVTVLLSLFISNCLNSQNINDRQIERSLKTFDYKSVIDRFEKVKDKTPTIFRLLAESYAHIGEFEQAENYYYLLANSDSAKIDDIFNYINVLRSNGKYQDSKKWAKQYYLFDTNNSYINLLLQNDDQFENLLVDNERFEIFKLDFNNGEQDFGVTFYGKNIVFTSTRQDVEAIRRTDNITGLSFLNLYCGMQKDDGQIVDVKPFDKRLNSKFHDGPASFTFDLHTVAFTRNNVAGNSQKKPVNMNIFFSTNENEKWTKPVPFKYNSKEFSVFHPFFSPDGDIMYFASNMPGGYGGADIYKITKDYNGQWETAVNLGPTVNTKGNELFPSVYDGRYLFFASDGHPGLGGLDVFLYDMAIDSSGSRNLGIPVNSNKDDFSFILDYNGQYGYFSSNREGGEGNDDIYGIKVLRTLEDKALIKCALTDKKSNVLPYPVAYLYDENNVKIDSANGNHQGKFFFEVEKNRSYTIDALKKGFFSQKVSVAVKNNDIYDIRISTEEKPNLQIYGIITQNGTHKPLEDVEILIKNRETQTSTTYKTKKSGGFLITLNNDLGDKLSYEITLKKEGYMTKVLRYDKLLLFDGKTELHNEIDLSMVKITKDLDLGRIADVSHIYFDLGDNFISPDIAFEIDKVIKLLEINPTIKVEIGCHTDCRYDGAYYVNLTAKRAKAIEMYMKKRLENPERITSKGYGATKQLIKCNCDSQGSDGCSQEELQVNRRTEFLIK